VRVLLRDVEGTVGARFMLTRNAEALAMMCPTSLLRLFAGGRHGAIIHRVHKSITW
jgi:hypothetical protein